MSQSGPPKSSVLIKADKPPPVKDASDGSSRDVLHEDGHHLLMKRGPQKPHDVGVSKGFKELHFPLQTSVLSVCCVGVRSIQANLLHRYQLAVAGQTTVHLVRRQQRLHQYLLL